MLLNPVEFVQSSSVLTSVVFGTTDYYSLHLEIPPSFGFQERKFSWFSSYISLSVFFAGSSSSTQSCNVAISQSSFMVHSLKR
jgi:hypothetical protein